MKWPTANKMNLCSMTSSQSARLHNNTLFSETTKLLGK